MSEIQEAIERLEANVKCATVDRRSRCHTAFASDIQTVCQALREAMKDKERLDWASRHKITNTTSRRMALYFNEPIDHDNIRQAIDAAMTPTPPVKQ